MFAVSGKFWKFLLAVVVLVVSPGCIVHLTGEGEAAFGMRNDNFFVMRHTVDGDKQGIEATSELEAPALVELIVPNTEPEPDVD